LNLTLYCILGYSQLLQCINTLILCY